MPAVAPWRAAAADGLWERIAGRGRRRAVSVAARVASVGAGRVTLDAGSKGLNPDVRPPDARLLGWQDADAQRGGTAREARRPRVRLRRAAGVDRVRLAADQQRRGAAVEGLAGPEISARLSAQGRRERKLWLVHLYLLWPVHYSLLGLLFLSFFRTNSQLSATTSSLEERSDELLGKKVSPDIRQCCMTNSLSVTTVDRVFG